MQQLMQHAQEEMDKDTNIDWILAHEDELQREAPRDMSPDYSPDLDSPLQTMPPKLDWSGNGLAIVPWTGQFNHAL